MARKVTTKKPTISDKPEAKKSQTYQEFIAAEIALHNAFLKKANSVNPDIKSIHFKYDIFQGIKNGNFDLNQFFNDLSINIGEEKFKYKTSSTVKGEISKAADQIKQQGRTPLEDAKEKALKKFSQENMEMVIGKYLYFINQKLSDELSKYRSEDYGKDAQGNEHKYYYQKSAEDKIKKMAKAYLIDSLLASAKDPKNKLADPFAKNIREFAKTQLDLIGAEIEIDDDKNNEISFLDRANLQLLAKKSFTTNSRN
jgi:hypothetical protein